MVVAPQPRAERPVEAGERRRLTERAAGIDAAATALGADDAIARLEARVGHADVARAANMSLAKVKPLAEWQVSGVLQSEDLLPKVLMWLRVELAQPLVCQAWKQYRPLALPCIT